MATCVMCQRPLSWRPPIGRLFCLRPLTQRAVCDRCLATFTRIDRATACPQCGRAQQQPGQCHDCERWNQMADVSATNAALFEYNEAMKAFMHAYKFIGDCRLAAVFQPSVTAAIMALRPDVVVPMPVAQSTLVKRGFNQATLLLPSSVPVVSALRVQTVTKVQQSRLGRTARLARTQPFELDGQAGRKLTGQQVLIFDDVYTTGRTMRFAMQVLQDAGPKSLTGLTLAR